MLLWQTFEHDAVLVVRWRCPTVRCRLHDIQCHDLHSVRRSHGDMSSGDWRSWQLYLHRVTINRFNCCRYVIQYNTEGLYSTRQCNTHYSRQYAIQHSTQYNTVGYVTSRVVSRFRAAQFRAAQFRGIESSPRRMHRSLISSSNVVDPHTCVSWSNHGSKSNQLKVRSVWQSGLFFDFTSFISCCILVRLFLSVSWVQCNFS